jgi:hypothetical protein
MRVADVLRLIHQGEEKMSNLISALERQGKISGDAADDLLGTLHPWISDVEDLLQAEQLAAARRRRGRR